VYLSQIKLPIVPDDIVGDNDPVASCNNVDPVTTVVLRQVVGYGPVLDFINREPVPVVVAE
jgi:hypothetical protein